MKHLSWKYVAGLVDGEGCIDMQGSRDKRDKTFYCRPRLRLTMSGEAGKMMVERLLHSFKGNHDYKERSFDNPNWQTAYGWCLTNKTSLRKFLQNIAKHLIVKKQQALFAIWWIDNIMGKQVAEEVRRLGVSELKAMKRDPHRLSERAAQDILALVR